ncbi:hypothetical protein M8C13_07305 [Crossiella sp. SN42]|uniref:hypothetical protein n=1 Tax=Crossiella sp. SN42 TaxID=2944808 RepID=UPI00207C3EED|nr:hypothetical protein [Crossiella sp. SN42]MCO1575564.1 hypothetical protein [Crossiella sp. SN42]
MNESVTALFRPGRSRRICIEPDHSRSVVLHHRSSILFLATGAAGTVENALVLDCDDLAYYDAHEVVATILALPAVLPSHLEGAAACDVPLVGPDVVTADMLVWDITRGLAVRETNHATVLTAGKGMEGRHFDIDLSGGDWWRLAQVLLSVDTWQKHLADLALAMTRTLRAELGLGCDGDSGTQVRVFHAVSDGCAVEVFRYNDSTCSGVENLLRRAFHLFNFSNDRGLLDPQTLLYLSNGNRALRIGDVVSVNEVFYRSTLVGWERIDPPVLTHSASTGTAPLSTGTAPRRPEHDNEGPR